MKLFLRYSSHNFYHHMFILNKTDKQLIIQFYFIAFFSISINSALQDIMLFSCKNILRPHMFIIITKTKQRKKNNFCIS